MSSARPSCGRTNAQINGTARPGPAPPELSYRQIAEQLGWGPPSRAYEAVQGALMDAVVESAEHECRVDLEGLDELARVAWRVLHERHLYVGQGGKAVVDPRRKLLGVDAPTKVTLLTMDQTEQ